VVPAVAPAQAGQPVQAAVTAEALALARVLEVVRTEMRPLVMAPAQQERAQAAPPAVPVPVLAAPATVEAVVVRMRSCTGPPPLPPSGVLPAHSSLRICVGSASLGRRLAPRKKEL
jgi:hypothetical protein